MLGTASPNEAATKMRANLEITYDHTVDALYIRFRRANVVTEHWAEGVAADFDAEGNLVGIEVLDALRRAGEDPSFANISLVDITKHRRRLDPGDEGPAPKERAG